MNDSSLLYECGECGVMLPGGKMHQGENGSLCAHCKSQLNQAQTTESSEEKRQGFFSRIFNWKSSDEVEEAPVEQPKEEEISQAQIEAVISQQKQTLKRMDRKAANPQPERLKFACNSCSYRFTLRKTSQHTKRCPYCGSGSVSVDKNSAENLLDEVSQLR